MQAVFAACEAWGVEIHPDARRLEGRIPRGVIAAAPAG
jgi:hypothetical protein